jgi:CubicO group peptidase (beta-lactamase class C family)
MTDIHGLVTPGYEAIRDAFASNFAHHGEVGAAFSLYVGGAPVVDIWGGQAGESAWQEDTLELVFSTTKGASAICANLLAQRGQLDFDAPVTTYWPEFAAAGKGEVPVRWLLCHKVGLPTIDAKLTFEEVLAVTPVVEALAAQAPFWEPGTKHGYHAVTYGWLVGEVVRRITGQSIGQFFASEIAAPLGLDFWIGLPESEEHRVAPLRPAPVPDDPEMRALMESVMGGDALIGRALTLNGALAGSGEADMGGLFNRRDIHATEMPAANGITTARSLARLYAACVGPVDGVQILTADTVAAASKEQSFGPDEVLMVESRFGTGFMLNGTLTPMLSETSFGHAGAGGSLGFGDADAGIGFGYVMCQMGDALTGDPRATNLVEATRACLR